MAITSIRLGKRFEGIVQKDLREFNYSTKTEYIRQAIRELHEKLRTEKAIRELAKNKGFAKRAGYKEPTQEEYERVREEVGKEILEEFRVRSLQANKP